MSKKYIFIADMFSSDYIGGAELSTEALMQKAINSKLPVFKIHSHKVTKDFLEENKDCHFVVCNFSNLGDLEKVYMCKNNSYSIVEYDYKFCKYRSIEKHFAAENKECDCISDNAMKSNIALYAYAEKIWFMSAKQREIFVERMKFLSDRDSEVLSSIFHDGDIRFIESLSYNEKNNKYIILDSDSWIKNTKKTIEFAEQNNIDYELVKNLPYHELLIKLSTSKGLIFLPSGGDTCPRITIEARLLGADVIVNDNVQHAKEDWYQTSETCLEYVKKTSQRFWDFYEK